MELFWTALIISSLQTKCKSTES